MIFISMLQVGYIITKNVLMQKNIIGNVKNQEVSLLHPRMEKAYLIGTGLIISDISADWHKNHILREQGAESYKNLILIKARKI